MMLLPEIFGNSLFDDLFEDFAFPAASHSVRSVGNMMRTDIRETENGYELDIDLPGFKKEDVKASLKDGYLTINAKHESGNDEKDKNGKFIRRERYSGSVSRSYFVGEGLTEEDIHAKFENGILLISLPKDAPKKVEEQKFISID